MACLFVIYIPCEDQDEPISFTPETLVSPVIYNNNLSLNADKKSISNGDEKVQNSVSLHATSLPSNITQTVNKPTNANIYKSDRSLQKEESENLLSTSDKTLKNDSANNGTQVSKSESGLFAANVKKKFQVTAAAELKASDNALMNRKASDANIMKSNADLNKDSFEVLTLAKYLHGKLYFLGIENDTWVKNSDNSEWQISFVVPASKALNTSKVLKDAGFGRLKETSISVFETNHHYEVNEVENNPLAIKQRTDFVKTIKSCLQVSQVVGAISNNAQLTFDFIVLILLAGIIAGLGLVENSSVVLVASMLISPLMGPIIGFTFGLFIQNKTLCKVSLRTELIGLLLCLSYGFIFGLISGSINNGGSYWGSDVSWPTSEMKSRGMLRSLLVGMLIALPSGAGVALAILGGNTGSLVGVAISASLLPPAVNAGLLWGFSLISALTNYPKFEQITERNYTFVAPDCPPLVANQYEFVYSCEMPKEAAILASVSLLLTIINIICIFIMGSLVMKIKEVSPLQDNNPMFWKQVVSDARESCKTLKGQKQVDMTKMAQELIKNIRMNKSIPNSTYNQILKDVKNDTTYAKMIEDIQPPEAADEKITEESQIMSGISPDIQIGDHKYHTLNHTDYKHLRTIGISNQDSCSTLNFGESKGCVIRMRRGFSASPNSDIDGVVMFDLTKLNDKKARQSCLTSPRMDTVKEFENIAPFKFSISDEDEDTNV